MNQLRYKPILFQNLGLCLLLILFACQPKMTENEQVDMDTLLDDFRKMVYQKYDMIHPDTDVISDTWEQWLYELHDSSIMYDAKIKRLWKRNKLPVKQISDPKAKEWLTTWHHLEMTRLETEKQILLSWMQTELKELHQLMDSLQQEITRITSYVQPAKSSVIPDEIDAIDHKSIEELEQTVLDIQQQGKKLQDQLQGAILMVDKQKEVLSEQPEWLLNDL
jgi:predicted nucleic acid-binding protein